MKKRVLAILAVAAGAAQGYDAPAITRALERKFLPDAAELSSWSSTFGRLEAMDRAADDAWLRLKTPEEYEGFRKELREKLHAAIGGLPERTPLKAKTLKSAKGEGWTAECVTFESVPGVTVTANFFLPDVPTFRPPYPAVVITCGHSTNGKAALGYNRMAAMFAKAGIAALIYDPMEQGERRHDPGIWHDVVGVRGILLGVHSNLIRIWDGMRAIDYVESRPEVDRARIGYCGNSGGGTMTSLMMAADGRIKAAAPCCYLTSLRELCEHIGPQDMEQNVWGQLAFGLNHAGYVLMSDAAVLQLGTRSDFFSYTGFAETHRVVAAAAANLGRADRYDAFVAYGPHGWRESTRTATVNWMRYHLRGEKEALPLDRPALAALDFGWDAKTYAGLDTGLVTTNDESGCWATPTGRTSGLAENRDILDVLRDRLAELERNRRPLGGAERAKTVRELAAIREPDAFKAVRIGADERLGDLTAERYALVFGDGFALPAVLFVPDEPKGTPTIVTGDRGRAATIDWVLSPLYGGDRAPVLSVDLTGWGDIGTETAARKEECIASMHYLMGETLVGRRATDLLACVDFLRQRFGGAFACPLIACGRAAIPAAHARAADPARLGGVSLRDAPKSWHDMVTIVDGAPPMGDIVPNALKAYDWPDLLK